MVAYFPLISALVLLVFSGILVLIRLVRPSFAFAWFVAVFGALIAWPFVLLSRSNLPQTISLFHWRPEWISEHSPFLLLDQYSWPFALALVTLVLSAILTDVFRAADENWSTWVGGLLLGGLGVLAVQAGNPMTLLLFWMVIDLSELVFLLAQHEQNIDSERVIIAFSARLAGTMLFVWAIISTSAIGERLEFSNIPPQVSIYLLLAAGLRLGVIPMHQPLRREYATRRNLGTVSRLVASGASMILLVRTAEVGVPSDVYLLLLLLTGFTAIYSAVAWATAPNEVDGRPYWILGLASFVVASTIRAQPLAGLAWGIVAILSGSVLFLYSTRHKYLLPLLVLGAVGLSSLPYMPIWNGVSLYSPEFELPLGLFLIAQSILLVGFLRHSIRYIPPPPALEKWVWIIYPWGLALLPGVLILIGWFNMETPLNLASVFPSIIVVILCGLLIFSTRQLSRRETLARNMHNAGVVLFRFFSLEWVYRQLWGVYFAIGRLIRVVGNILEGDGGVLWAILLVVLFVAILAQVRLG